MRVDDRNLAGPATQTGKPAESQEIDRALELKGFQSRGAAGADQVELSGLAARLSHALSALAADQAGRVMRLTKAYDDGRYAVDPAALGRTLAAEILAATRANGGTHGGNPE